MMLTNKVAVVYGVGGGIGGAVARAFAREGARVFVTGRHRAKVEAVAKDIASAGGFAEAAEVDALDEKAIDEHLEAVVGKVGRVDISFNAIGVHDTQALSARDRVREVAGSASSTAPRVGASEKDGEDGCFAVTNNSLEPAERYLQPYVSNICGRRTVRPPRRFGSSKPIGVPSRLDNASCSLRPLASGVIRGIRGSLRSSSSPTPVLWRHCASS